MVRDEEIKRLVKYAEGLGLKVLFSQMKNPDAVADWHIDNSQITVYSKKNGSKIETVLSLIHELGHAQHNVWEKDRKVDERLSNVLSKIDEYESKGLVAPAQCRNALYRYERDSAAYWEAIYKETNMKFPKWRLFATMELDIWVYEYYAQTGNFPKRKQTRSKWRELAGKHRRIKYE